MIKSMTGYGGAKGSVDGFELSIEMKSVNNRYLDTSVRMPRSFIFAEEAVKSAVQSHISRGKVDVFISVGSMAADNVVVTVNEAIAESYIAALKGVSGKYGVKDGLTNVDVGRFQEVLSIEKREADREAVAAGIVAITEEALCEFDKMREREGARLHEDMMAHIAEIERLVAFVDQRSPQTVAEYRQKLEQKMREVLENTTIDEARILTEAAIFADRVAIDEETVRLRSHISQMREMLAGGSPVGRKLDFLIQEFNREANTIGSKCNNVEISKAVVDLKSEIEKLREQLQNIE